MIICLSFIGSLPKYIVENIHQIRCFYDGEIYLIINDLNSIYIKSIEKYNVNIINYDDVICHKFLNIYNNNKHKFCFIGGLIGREDLFMRAFERFFILNNFLKQNDKKDCLFLELDNLIYDDPNNWIESFSTRDLGYMYDNVNRFASGIMYIKDKNSLDGYLNYILEFIKYSNDFMTEMTVLSIYYEQNKDKVQILPTYWNNSNIPEIAHNNFDKYNNSIFDAAAIGCYLLGMDPYHTDGIIKTHLKSLWSGIDYTNLNFEWKVDNEGRNKPYVWNGEKWILINNLHIHSKDLESGLSKKII